MGAAPSSQVRLDRLRQRLRLPAGTAVLLPSDSNDTWRIGSVVVRVCWRGDRERFRRDAAVTAALPPEVPYPEVLETGQETELAWQVTRAVEGELLVDAWPRLSLAGRRDAVRRIGQILAALNRHDFTDEVVTMLAAPRPHGDASPEALIGADLNPLPHQRALLLAAHARELPYADRALIDAVEARLRDLAPVDRLSDRAPAARCIHGDAHLGNVLWRDGSVVALLDFEWVRLGPPDLEIEPYLRPDLGLPAVTDADRRDILGWLAEGHPDAFSAPHLIERLWLYQLAYLLRHLLIWPPDRPWSELSDDDPLPLLRRVVNGPEHLRGILDGG